MCITGEAGGFRDHFGAKKKKEKKIGTNVATFQRRDVWSTEEKVNECVNVATSSRFLPQNHKKQKRPN